MQKIKVNQYKDGDFFVKLPTGIRKESIFCLGKQYYEDGWICIECNFELQLEKYCMPVKYKVYNRSIPETKRTAKARCLREIEKISNLLTLEKKYYE